MFSFEKSSRKIIAVGSALVDILIQESDAFLSSITDKKGGMLLVDVAMSESLLQKSSKSPTLVPGGSACNTCIGLAKLGNTTSFIGKRGEDELGALLETALRTSGVEPLLLTASQPTGRVVSIITPDAQRTMFTYLGAASETKSEDINIKQFENSSLVYLEGYLLFNEPYVRKILFCAQQAGAKICLDLASFTVVEASKSILPDLIHQYIDILIANEDEAFAYTGEKDHHKALEIMSTCAALTIVKRGKHGSIISYNGTVTPIGIAGNGNVLDTTGAGDLWASGFIYGIVNGLSIEESGNLGSLCGYEVCKVLGAHIPDVGWERIKSTIKKQVIL